MFGGKSGKDRGGGHDPAVEDALGKASFNADTAAPWRASHVRSLRQDNLPMQVWAGSLGAGQPALAAEAQLLKEAFMKSANPMGRAATQ